MVTIAFEKRKLSNGMDVILHEDNSRHLQGLLIEVEEAYSRCPRRSSSPSCGTPKRLPATAPTRPSASAPTRTTGATRPSVRRGPL